MTALRFHSKLRKFVGNGDFTEKGMAYEYYHPNGFMESRGILRAVVLYDTVFAAKRGVSSISRVATLLNDQRMEFHFKPWRLDVLNEPFVSNIVTYDIRTAQIIILCTTGVARLSYAFRDWLSRMLAQRNGEAVAVVALLGLKKSSARSASGDLRFIEQLTLQSGLDFFAPGNAQASAGEVLLTRVRCGGNQRRP